MPPGHAATTGVSRCRRIRERCASSRAPPRRPSWAWHAIRARSVWPSGAFRRGKARNWHCWLRGMQHCAMVSIATKPSATCAGLMVTRVCRTHCRPSSPDRWSWSCGCVAVRGSPCNLARRCPLAVLCARSKTADRLASFGGRGQETNDRLIHPTGCSGWCVNARPLRRYDLHASHRDMTRPRPSRGNQAARFLQAPQGEV